MKNVSDHLNILVIEDNPTDLYLLEDMLQSSKAKIENIYTADRASSAYNLLQQYPINLVLLDLSLPDSFGIESFLKIKGVTQKIPVIILTGLTDSEVALETLKHGAQDYLVKGEFNTEVLVKSIQYSIERKNAEEKILASEEKYRQMFYKNPFPAWIYDQDTLQILKVNDAAIRKYGYEREEFLNLNVKDICPEEDISQAMQSIIYRNISNKVKGNLWQHRKKNNSTILAEVTFHEIDYHGKKAMQAQINDVTEKVRLEKELAQQQKIKQQQITEAVLSAQEKERKGIGEELHDNINQILATAKLFLNSSLSEKELNIDLLTKSQSYISMAMEEIRKLSKALITPAFIELGLKKAIEDLIGNIVAVKKINITTDIDLPDETSLDEGLKVTIYRIIQEQLNNILKYSEASVVTTSIKTNEDIIILSITDNGKGFDTHTDRKGIGITNMTSRAELYNGKVEIDSSPGNGCRLTVKLQAKDTLPQRAA